MLYNLQNLPNLSKFADCHIICQTLQKLVHFQNLLKDVVMQHFSTLHELQKRNSHNLRKLT